MFLKKSVTIPLFSCLFVLAMFFPAMISAQDLPSETLNARYRIQVVAIALHRGIDKAEQYAQRYSKRFYRCQDLA